MVKKIMNTMINVPEFVLVTLVQMDINNLYSVILITWSQIKRNTSVDNIIHSVQIHRH